MNKKIITICLFIIGLLSSLQAQPGNPVQALQQAGGTKEYANAPYLIVWDKTSTRVMESGLGLVDREMLYKVLTSAGALQLKSLTFNYDPQSAYVEIRQAAIIHGNGQTETIPLERVDDYPAPARAIYWGAREKLLPIGRLEPGDGVLVKWFQKGFTYALLDSQQGEDERYIPPMKGHFYDIVPFYSEVPVQCKSYQVTLPASKRLQYEFYNGEARHFVHAEGDQTVFFWEKKNIMPFENEPGAVDISDVGPKLLLSTSPDWQTKSLWFYKVNEDYGSFEFDQAIKRKVDEITRGAVDDWEKISRLTHWVAEEIRYSGISMGQGEGYTLHKGTMTFTDRCGVCKDKAGMLITMLRAAGFQSFPAMTMAGQRIDRIPADQFNHCVTLVKIKDQYHLLDPTWVPGVRELWSSAEQQQEYLMGVPEGMDLKSTPLSPPQNHFARYRISSALDSNGTLRGTMSVQTEGQSDSTLRRGFTRRLRHTWGNQLRDALRLIHPKIKVADLHFPDPYDLSRPFEIRFGFEIPGFATLGKKQAYLTPISGRLPFADLLAFLRMNLSNPKRAHPFRTRCSQLVEVVETLDLPAGYATVYLPELKKVSGSGTDFQGTVGRRGNRLEIREKLTFKKRIYAAEDWDSFRRSILEFKKFSDSPLIFSKRGGQ